MSLTIRRLAAEDRPRWEPLWRGYLTFYGVTLEPSVSEATWTRLLDPSVDLHGLAAVDEAGELLGIVHFLYHPVTWSVSPRCYLEDLFVAESARGLGAGRMLIEAVYAEADARGADQVYWLTETSNAPARRLYDAVGRLTTFVKYQR